MLSSSQWIINQDFNNQSANQSWIQSNESEILHAIFPQMYPEKSDKWLENKAQNVCIWKPCQPLSIY